ncbi:DinB family protein [Saccharibacillus sp. JS10]|uniref:DinB family protein n=1 Tax=Saccharibacillus sp. JS10 TaxID=2950552 RepID=UPI00210E855C|nr:DinB family protein [Saccharibacillus sp. JS10]MCQ4088621.1 DinB family protein [Saccharibacillus sp. JS10]
MNLYCSGILHQLHYAIDTVIEMLNTLETADLNRRPTSHKSSVGELFIHLSMLCEADLKIGMGASFEEMEIFYATSKPPNTLPGIEQALRLHYSNLKYAVSLWTEEDLQQVTVSYWGVSYSRYEWLVETLAHFYHHRGQLHAMLVHALGKDPGILLFE